MTIWTDPVEGHIKQRKTITVLGQKLVTRFVNRLPVVGWEHVQVLHGNSDVREESISGLLFVSL
jgi:hypothetical protein